MKLSISATKGIKKTDILVFPLFKTNNVYQALPASVAEAIDLVFQKGIFDAELNSTFPLSIPDSAFPPVLLVGLGDKEKIDDERLRQAGGSAGAFCRERSLKSITIQPDNIADSEHSVLTFTEGLYLSTYSFSVYKSDNKTYMPHIILKGVSSTLKKRLEETARVVESVFFARDLVNTPSNDLTPEKLANKALEIKSKKIKVKVLDRADIAKEGMDAFLAVSRGSKNPPELIVLEYKGGSTGPLVLIGKSITFDSGGISIKPSSGMEKMKYDMAGGATVLAVIKAAQAINLPLHLIALLPAAENMPGGSATRPGDIVSTISGKSIEIINTDAEGRLTLADAIEYAKRFDPEYIIDIATLTGACSVALGNEAAAAMSNSEELMKTAVHASEKTGEKIWPMPLYEEYGDYLKSDVADIRNTGTDRSGSLVTAAYFLKEFVQDIPWLHLDIASVAWTDKDRQYIPKGASGFGVRLLLELIREIYSL